MTSPDEWTQLSQDLGLELCELAPIEALRVAALDMHGLDPGQEGELPPEEQTKIRNLEKALKLMESLGALAQLSVAAGSWKTTLLRGDYRGYRANVHSLQGQISQIGISLRFPRPLGLGLRIVREGKGHKIGKFLRMTQDLQLQDPVLDPLVLIQATDTAGAQAWLSHEGLREDLRDLFQLSQGIEVLDWGLRYAEPHGGLTPQRVQATLDAMRPIAEHVKAPGE